MRNAKKRQKFFNQQGFTIIELLVVISIISLLASIMLVAFKGARDKARMARIAADFEQIQKGIDVARNDKNNILGEITKAVSSWPYCSVCAFGQWPAPPPGVPVVTNATAMANHDKVWQSLGFSKAPMDPWGTPYLLDENEGEGGNCRYDTVYSAGPDRLWDGFIDNRNPPGQITVFGTDGYGVSLTLWQCQTLSP